MWSSSHSRSFLLNKLDIVADAVPVEELVGLLIVDASQELRPFGRLVGRHAGQTTPVSTR